MTVDSVGRRGASAAVDVPSAGMAPPTLSAVYESHGAYVFRCLRSLGLHGPLLDDAMQDVFMVVQQKLASFDGRYQLRTWLYAIVVRVARRYRSRYALDATRFVEREPADPLRIELELEQRQRLLLAQRALSALDSDKREVFVLAQVEGMSAPEIAQAIGLPMNTVYSRLRAARLAFAAEVERLTHRNRSGRCP